MYNLNSLNLGNNLKQIRETRNITITKLGELICKSKSTVSKYESGDIIPDLYTLLEICNALNININQLCPELNQLNNNNFPNISKASKLFFYYYTENKLVTSIAELYNYNDKIKVKFYNGLKDIKKYADSSSYYYEGEMTIDNNIGYINLENKYNQGTQFEKIQISFSIPWSTNNDKTLFFILALTPLSIPVVKKGIVSMSEIKEINKYNDFIQISKKELQRIKENNSWILNESNYNDFFYIENS